MALQSLDIKQRSATTTPAPQARQTMEIAKLIGKVERAGYALVPLDLHYSKGRVKISVGLAKGKKQFDKRETEKERDWDREKARLIRAKG